MSKCVVFGLTLKARNYDTMIKGYNDIILKCFFFQFFYDMYIASLPVPAAAGAAHLLRSWVRIPPESWMFVCCECCVLSGRGLCDELITRPETFYRLWCVVVCDLENLKNEAMTRVGSQRHRKKKVANLFRGTGN
jgi:hypothetical protein